MSPIGCQDAIRRLWDLLDGDLATNERHEVEDHLAFCLRCCGELEFAKELRHLLRTKGHGEVPGEVRGRLEAFIDDLGEPTGTGADR
jgi:mycothiol system anti-sigma-R factor